MKDHTHQLRTEVEAILDRARAEILVLLGDVEPVTGGTNPPVAASPPPEEWVVLARAADVRGVTEQTMVRLAIKHGLGVKRSGRWRIDLVRLRRWQANEPYVPLNAIPEA